jgi:hypothetical protein
MVKTYMCVYCGCKEVPYKTEVCPKCKLKPIPPFFDINDIKLYVSLNIGCLECGVPTNVIGVYDTFLKAVEETEKYLKENFKPFKRDDHYSTYPDEWGEQCSWSFGDCSVQIHAIKRTFL